jgi:hypothetical protein
MVENKTRRPDEASIHERSRTANADAAQSVTRLVLRLLLADLDLVEHSCG